MIIVNFILNKKIREEGNINIKKRILISLSKIEDIIKKQ